MFFPFRPRFLDRPPENDKVTIVLVAVIGIIWIGALLAVFYSHEKPDNKTGTEHVQQDR